MTILTALNRLYARMLDEGEAPRPGFSTEKISFEMVIASDGRPLYLNDLRSHAGRKPAPRSIEVPEAVKRSSGITPNFLWDKTAYVLGVIGIEDAQGQAIPGQGKRTADEHAAFAAAHREHLDGTEDAGLQALLAFLDQWRPEFFAAEAYPVEALDQNIVFRLDGDVGSDGAPRFLHQRPAVLPLLAPSDSETIATCLVTGEQAPAARLHPKFGGISDKQAAIVSFNIGSKDERGAASSYGKVQGENAPVSEAAAYAYGTALKSLLAHNSTLKLRIGDTTVAFWAEADTPDAASFSEMLMRNAFSPPDDAAETNLLRAHIHRVAEGRGGDDPNFDPSTRVYLLGLAPNAARLSVRFWHPGSVGDFARNVAQFWDDLAIEPVGWKGPPAAWSLLFETAIQVGGKAKVDTIPPLLGGNVMRAVLTGQPLPRMLLSAVIGRIRADGQINGRRAAICKAVVNRISAQEEIPVSLDPHLQDIPYSLGRLFAAYAYAEKSYADRTSTIRDKYLAGASANPRRVFPLLMRGYEHNRSGLLKASDQRRGSGVKADKAVASIVELLDGPDNFPPSLSLEEQGRFFVGFYHQWNAFFEKPEAAAEAAAEEVLEQN